MHRSSVPVHVVIPTHTPRHLDAVLVGLARQSTPPASINISCDVVDPAIDRVLVDCCRRLGLRVHYIRRAHHGIARLSQVRNNGVRSILQRIAPECLADTRSAIRTTAEPSSPRHPGRRGSPFRGSGEAERSPSLRELVGQVLILDGDMLCPPETVERHGALAARHDLVIAHRIMLSPDETQRLAAIAQAGLGGEEGSSQAVGGDDESALLDWRAALAPTPAQLQALAILDRKARRHRRLRRLGLTKAHKPKIIGAHFSVSLRAWLRVNGFDEQYTRYGMNDDEFGRRVHRSGANCAVAIRDIPAFHLHHPTREAARWRDNPGFARWKERRRHPVFCDDGLLTPLPQHPVYEDLVTPASHVEGVSATPAPWWQPQSEREQTSAGALPDAPQGAPRTV